MPVTPWKILHDLPGQGGPRKPVEGGPVSPSNLRTAASGDGRAGIATGRPAETRPPLAGRRYAIPGVPRNSQAFREFLDFDRAFQGEAGVLGGPGRSLGSPRKSLGGH